MQFLRVACREVTSKSVSESEPEMVKIFERRVCAFALGTGQSSSELGGGVSALMRPVGGTLMLPFGRFWPALISIPLILGFRGGGAGA